jgi:hypothetical protein
MEMSFERAGTPNMSVWIRMNGKDDYTIFEGIDIERESVPYQGDASWCAMHNATKAQVGEWLLENNYYINVRGIHIVPSLPHWDFSPEADRIKSGFIGYTMTNGVVSPVIWDEFRKVIGPLEIGQAKETLIRYISEATGDHGLRAIFEMYGKLGKLI